uniref:Uncharacterized protein n=1 Tax=Octopus bimaculoides TaxID=37653 RepID=A0A0L8G433_OCTBM
MVSVSSFFPFYFSILNIFVELTGEQNNLVDTAMPVHLFITRHSIDERITIIKDQYYIQH